MRLNVPPTCHISQGRGWNLYLTLNNTPMRSVGRKWNIEFRLRIYVVFGNIRHFMISEFDVQECLKKVKNGITLPWTVCHWHFGWMECIKLSLRKLYPSGNSHTKFGMKNNGRFQDTEVLFSEFSSRSCSECSNAYWRLCVLYYG
jgi:hypothetical protein